ncbi:uncharacterized protein BCR38DRAFT_57401 [Pseudomassariella vexata]|uniref:Uncharacterized protein n=1 Tax=Pseudomassariella vexata TaxID=1141098 RepID=A0A1Y2DJL6_9PEZI|nr:uncharacterized protein BCR38DRAFT_57401 [Pseudomassariella vexata]ORY59453.1 hypothetical protein BCR38DRAFT_57401 [Pseudomassariella vexata]
MGFTRRVSVVIFATRCEHCLGAKSHTEQFDTVAWIYFPEPHSQCNVGIRRSKPAGEDPISDRFHPQRRCWMALSPIASRRRTWYLLITSQIDGLLQPSSGASYRATFANPLPISQGRSDSPRSGSRGEVGLLGASWSGSHLVQPRECGDETFVVGERSFVSEILGEDSRISEMRIG